MLILNNMYSGSYLYDKNIGHEVINLIKDINGNYNIWLNAGGTVSENVAKDIKDLSVDILFIRKAGIKIYKVIGIAKNCKYVDKSTKKYTHEAYEERKNTTYKIKDITFKLADIYNKNIYKGKEGEETVLYTFSCKEIYETLSEVYITNDVDMSQNSNSIFYIDYKMMYQLRAYLWDIDLNKNTKNYDFLNVDNGNWKLYENTIEFSDDLFNNVNKKNLYKLIRKDNDELTISNSIASFLDVIDKKSEFVNEISKVSGDFDKLLREEFNVDLLFANNKSVIIIENKIDSGINGIPKRKKSFEEFVKDYTEEYFEKSYYESEMGDDEKNEKIDGITKIICDYFENEEGNKEWSQLAKYYVFALNKILQANENASKDDIINNIKPLLLMPKYRQFEIKSQDDHVLEILNKKYSFSKYYKILTYDKIYEFFNKYKYCINDQDDIVRYNDFLGVLSDLSKELDDTLEKEMMTKLYNKVKEIKENE